MARTPSQMIDLGSPTPDFSLPDTVSGKAFTRDSLRGRVATVYMFICNHCPFVKHVNHELVLLANTYASRGISFVAVSSNDAAAYPADGPEQMKDTAMSLQYPFPYLYDETQEVARRFDAACTPDFFVYDHDDKLVYRGQLDDSRPGNDHPVNGKDMRLALEALLAGKEVSATQKPSIGCNIKWRG